MKAIAIDIETTGLSFLKDSIICLGYWSPEFNGVLTTADEMKEFLVKTKRDGFNIIMQNGKFDQKFIYKHLDIWVDVWFDTYLAASLLADRPATLKLDVMACHYLGLPLYKDKGMIENLASLPIEDVKQYCLLDCGTTYRLARKLYKLLAEDKQIDFLIDRLCPASNLIAKMEYNGITVDTSLLKSQWEQTNLSMVDLESSLRTTYKDIISEYEQNKINEKVASLKRPPTEKQLNSYKEKFAFNFRSPSQCLWLLHEKLGLECKDPRDRHSEAGTSTGVDALNCHINDHPIVTEILKLRGMDKMLGYYREWDEAASVDGKIHANFNLATTRTGRLSSSNPNMQQVKRGEPRKLFTSSKGRKLVIMDYAQIEPRVVAELSKDPTLIESFQTGRDFYSVLIKRVMNIDKSPEEIKNTMPSIRAVGKEIGLAILYGTGPFTLASILAKRTGKVYSSAECAKIIQDYFDGFPLLQEFKHKVEHFANKHGWLQNIFGRHVYVDAGEVYHKSVNTLIQSSASDICLLSQTLVAENIDQEKAKLVLAVHDEVVYDVEESYVDEFCKISKYCMEKDILKFVDKSTPWVVPLVVEQKIGYNWSEK